MTFPLLLLTVSLSWIAAVSANCATKEFMPCVVQLNTQKVHFDTNIMHVLYNITTEAKLMHTCRAYEKTFPCFAQRLATCGTKAQKSMLDRGKRLHTYLCAPFSLQRQKIFLRQSKCIQSVLQMPVDSKCKKPEGLMAQKLHSCRSKCGDDHVCNTKVDLSEIAACTYLLIEKTCGSEAAQFYSQMQQVITNREFPVQCPYTLRGSTTPTRRTEKPQTTTVIPFSTKKQEQKKKTTPYYYSTSYITVYPEGLMPKTSVKLQPAIKVVMKNGPSLQPSASQTSLRSITTTTPLPPPSLAAPLDPTPTLPTSFLGARPIPEVSLVLETTLNPRLRAAFPPKFSSHPTGTKDEKWIPWYLANKNSGSAPSNPMIAPFLDSTTHPTLVPPLLSNDVPNGATTSRPSFNFVFNQDPTPEPFKININWMDHEEKPWYQQTVPSLKSEESTTESNAFQVMAPFINQLKSQQLNFTEMGSQASNYFSAALSALESVAEDTRTATADNNPWRSIIDAVAPTIQKVSPNIIPRIRQEMERLESIN